MKSYSQRLLCIPKNAKVANYLWKNESELIRVEDIVTAEAFKRDEHG